MLLHVMGLNLFTKQKCHIKNCFQKEVIITLVNNGWKLLLSLTQE